VAFEEEDVEPHVEGAVDLIEVAEVDSAALLVEALVEVPEVEAVEVVVAPLEDVAAVAEAEVAKRVAQKLLSSSIVTLASSWLKERRMPWSPRIWMSDTPFTVKRESLSRLKLMEKSNTVCGTLSAPRLQLPSLVV